MSNESSIRSIRLVFCSTSSTLLVSCCRSTSVLIVVVTYKLHPRFVGNHNLQSLWRHFYTQMQVDFVCYVVDSSDEASMKREFKSLHTMVRPGCAPVRHRRLEFNLSPCVHSQGQRKRISERNICGCDKSEVEHGQHVGGAHQENAAA